MKLLTRHRIILTAAALLLPTAAFTQADSPSKEKAPTPSGGTKLRVEVTAGEKGLPVENASVYVKYVEAHTLSKDKKIEMNLKTNHNGIAKSPELRRGKVLIQVIAEGWRTFGRWYELTEDEQTIKIRLEKPPRWY